MKDMNEKFSKEIEPKKEKEPNRNHENKELKKAN
jgi:hypothetical protein